MRLKPSTSAYAIAAAQAGISAALFSTGFGRTLKELREGGCEVDGEGEDVGPPVGATKGKSGRERMLVVSRPKQRQR